MSDTVLRMETNPLRLKATMRVHGIKYVYWYLRSLGASRYQTLRAIFLAK